MTGPRGHDPLAMTHVAVSRAAPDIQTAMETRGECSAALIQTVPVRARTAGSRTLDVDVHVFELIDCARSRTGYAWRADDRVFTALEIGPIRSPIDAVCAVLADEARRRNLALGSRLSG